MADKAIFEIVVTNKGLKINQKGLDDLGTSAQRANKASGDLYSTQAKGVIGTANSSKSFSKLAETIGNGGGGLVGAYATLAANAFAVSAAFNALRNGAQVQMILEGLELQGARTGRSLTSVAKSIEEITQGALSGADAMRASALGTSAGLGANDLEELTKVATNASLVLGRNIPDSMDRIIKGVTKLEPELLDELGLMTKLTEASENYARANGKSAASLTNMEKRLAFVEAIKAEGTLKYDGVAEELGTNNLDKLAASFVNLANSITGAVASSKPLGAVLTLLIESSTALLGALTILGSYVATQYTKGLRLSSVEALNASKALDQKAKALEEHTKKRMGDTKAILENSRAEAKAASELSTKQRGKALATQQAALLGDKGAQEAWVKSREASTKRYERELQKLSGVETEAAKKRRASLNQNITGNKLEIEATKAAIEAEKAYAAARASTAQNMLRTEAAKQGSLAQGRASLAMEAAAAGKLSQSYNNIIASTRSYSRSLNLSAEASRNAAAAAITNGKATTLMSSAMSLVAPAALRGRVAIHALTLSVKTLGIAFATALPWLGMIMVAFSMAQMAYESFFKSEETKKKEKALESLGTVLDSLTKSTKEYTKVQESSNISIGDKTLKALTIKTNAMVELTEAYLEYNDVVSKTNAPESFIAQSKDLLGSSMFTGLGGLNAIRATLVLAPSIDQELLKKELQLSTETAAKAAKNMISGFDIVTDLFGGNGVSDEEEQLLKTIDVIATFDSELAASIDTSKGFEEAQKQTAAALRRGQPVWEKAQLAVQNFSEAIRIAEEAQASFITSIIPSTKFDNTIDGFTALNKSIVELQSSLAGSQFSGTEIQELLTKLGPATTKVLNVEDQLNLGAVKSQQIEVNRLQSELIILQKEKKGETKEALAIEAQIKEIQKEQSRALQNSMPTIIEATNEYRKQLINAQIMTITMQGQQAIAQASLSVLQRRGVVLAEDAAKQMQAENNILALQQKQLSGEKVFLEIDVAKQKSRLRELEDNIKLINLLKQKETVERSSLINQEIAGKRAEAARARAAGDQRTVYIAESRIAELNRLKNGFSEESIKYQQEYEDILNNVRRTQAGINNIEAMRTALSMQMTSSAEQAAASARRQLEIDTQRRNIQRDTMRLNSDISITNKEIYNMLSMSGREIAVQNYALEERAAQAREALKVEYEQKKAALVIEEQLARAQGLPKRVAFYREETRLLDSQYASAVDLAKAEESREKVQLASVKTLQEKLDLERQVLDIRERTLETLREEQEARISNKNLLRDLEAIRTGTVGSESVNRLKAIEAAELQAELAEKEYTLKVALIKMEFSLLSAQRAQLLLDLQARREILEKQKKELEPSLQDGILPGEIIVSRGRSNEIDKNIDILSKAIDSLKDTNLKEALDSALTAAGLVKDAAVLNSEIAKTRGLRTEGGFVSSGQNMRNAVEEGVRQETDRATVIIDAFNVHFETIKQSLEELGPEGAVVTALAQSASNITYGFVDAFDTISNASSSTTERVSAGLQALSAVISGVSTILAASSNARISNIDREIAAEQKRDGKSAQSLAAIEAMEKKKDSIARKQFNTNKKLMMANAVVSTAAGIANALGSGLPPPANIILAGIIGAMGAAQLAIISGTQYESTSSSRSTSIPSTLSIGKRGDTVDLARGPSANAGGEVGFIRGSQGTGSNANNFRTIGSAYGGELMRGYGNRGFVVGEKGPEVITPETPINVTPANDVMPQQPLNATFNIQALDASGVEELLVGQKGNIIKMLRDAANASGQGFMEDVNVNVYTRPQVNKL